MTLMQSTELSPEALNHQWKTEGYVLIRNLFNPDEVAKLLEICDHVRRVWTVKDAVAGKSIDDDNCTNFRHINHPDYLRDRPDYLRTILETCADSRPIEVARAVFGEEPVFYTTTYWFNPRKSRNGNWHRDTQFITKTDEEEKKMLFGQQEMGIQIQIPLVHSEDSELVPRSHLRWDSDVEYQIRKADGWKHAESDEMPGAVRFSLNPGDAIAFNPCGLHRGRYHADKKRRTLMLTYIRDSMPAEDTYFSHQPWAKEGAYYDGVTQHTREFFGKFIAKYSHFWTGPWKG